MNDKKKPKKKFKLIFSDNERIDAAIKLGMYFLCFALVIITFRVTNKEILERIPTYDYESSSKEEISSIKTIDYNTLRELLLNNNYDFSYEIYFNDELSISYIGTRNGSSTIGFKKTNNEYTKFMIENNKVYEERLNGFIESNKVFTSVNEDLIDSEYILDSIKELTPIIKEIDDTKEYTYTLDKTYEIIIKMDINSIYEININYLNRNTKYILKYQMN